MDVRTSFFSVFRSFCTIIDVRLESWKNRNDKLWNDAGKTSPIIISITMAWYEEFLQANKSPTGLSRIHSQVSQHWSPPPNGCLLLNVDGSFLRSNNFGGVGGVLRSCTGDFIAGFSYRKNFVSSAQHIELLAIQAGLQFLQAMDISCATIHSDCLLAVQAINREVEDLSSLGSLI